MKLNLTLVSVIYVAWYLGRPRIETQMMFLAVLFCCQLQSSRLVIITKEANGYLGSRSIKELSEYMMNYVIFVTESAENANKRVHILILILKQWQD